MVWLRGLRKIRVWIWQMGVKGTQLWCLHLFCSTIHKKIQFSASTSIYLLVCVVIDASRCFFFTCGTLYLLFNYISNTWAEYRFLDNKNKVVISSIYKIDTSSKDSDERHCFMHFTKVIYNLSHWSDKD